MDQAPGSRPNGARIRIVRVCVTGNTRAGVGTDHVAGITGDRGNRTGPTGTGRETDVVDTALARAKEHDVAGDSPGGARVVFAAEPARHPWRTGSPRHGAAVIGFQGQPVDKVGAPLLAGTTQC